ncbi:MAG: YrhB domain-containing protein [Planctomycetota bacterium]|nr:YrhB domain-containing protein [Planctomycetota bacterium]
MERQEARTLALNHFYDKHYGNHINRDGEAEDFDVVDEHTIKKSYGWAFMINTKTFIETGDFMHCLGGNGPIVVLHSGEIHPLGAAYPVVQTLKHFEDRQGLG